MGVKYPPTNGEYVLTNGQRYRTGIDELIGINSKRIITNRQISLKEKPRRWREELAAMEKS